VLGVAAIVASVVAGMLWLTPWWSARPVSGIDWALLQHAPLGFALPAALAWVHWAFWRNRNAHVRTRVALGSAALLSAAFVTLEVVGARTGAAPGAIDWVSVAVAVLSFGLALGINFAPGVTSEQTEQLDLEKYLKRDRRSEQRR
jgi:hypothetical protein